MSTLTSKLSMTFNQCVTNLVKRGQEPLQKYVITPKIQNVCKVGRMYDIKIVIVHDDSFFSLPDMITGLMSTPIAHSWLAIALALTSS